LLVLDGVRAGYGKVDVLHDVSLRVDTGEFVCLIGANGAGKSTTLRSISRIIPIHRGRIAFDARDISGARPSDVVRMGIAQVPEGRRMLARQSVVDNLLLGAYTRADGAEIQADLERQFARFPRLAERRHQMAGTLSGGEQQMLAIARALIRDPKIILLDEPFEGLAPVIVRDLMRACRELAAAGQTIVLVEQNIAATLALASRVYMLNNGHVVHEGPAAEIKAQPEILKKYLGV